MTTYYMVQGDTDDTCDARLNGVDSLSAVTEIVAYVWRDGVAKTALGVDLVDAVLKTVRLKGGSWITTAATGPWWLQWQATIGGKPRTWPKAPDMKPDVLHVLAQGD
jgi:hypothetical protein